MNPILLKSIGTVIGSALVAIADGIRKRRARKAAKRGHVRDDQEKVKLEGSSSEDASEDTASGGDEVQHPEDGSREVAPQVCACAEAGDCAGCR